MEIEFTIRQVIDDIKSVLDTTGGVCCPLFCLCRRWHLKRLCKSFNRWHSDKGIYIKLLGSEYHDNNYIDPDALYVFMNVPKRMEFCAKRGIAFQMPEFLPTPQSKPRHNTRSNRNFGGHGPGGDGGGGCGNGGGGCGDGGDC